MILRGVIVANCMSDQIPGAMLLGTLLNETHLHHLRPEVVTVDVIVYTFDTDDEAALADGGSCGVEGHGDVTAGVDDDRLFAESSTFAQMNHLRHHHRAVVCRRRAHARQLLVYRGTIHTPSSSSSSLLKLLCNCNIQI